jgi:hypothetical protein
MRLLLTLALVLVSGVALGYAAHSLLHAVRQRRSEKILAKLLAEDATFRERLTKFADDVYQLGRARHSTIEDLWFHVLNRAMSIKPHGYLVADALDQPSKVDRYRYLGKVVEQALGMMLDIPVAELELEPPALVKSEEMAGV